MSNKNIDYNYIEYSNHFEFNDRVFAFRKKFLFDITTTPQYIHRSEQGWWIGRNLFTPSKIKKLLKIEKITVNIKNVQWFRQVELHECFNLDNK